MACDAGGGLALLTWQRRADGASVAVPGFTAGVAESPTNRKPKMLGRLRCWTRLGRQSPPDPWTTCARRSGGRLDLTPPCLSRERLALGFPVSPSRHDHCQGDVEGVDLKGAP